VPVEGCEPQCGSSVDWGDTDDGFEKDNLWLELFTDDKGRLNIHACGFKYSAGVEIVGTECAPGLFKDGFDILVGEYCRLNFDRSDSAFTLSCSGVIGPRTAAIGVVDGPDFANYDACAEGAIAGVVAVKGAGGPEGWAVEGTAGCVAGVLYHLFWNKVKPW
jgi:hypothetical protein